MSENRGNFGKFRPGCHFKALYFKMQIVMLRPTSKSEPYAREESRAVVVDLLCRTLVKLCVCLVQLAHGLIDLKVLLNSSSA